MTCACWDYETPDAACACGGNDYRDEHGYPRETAAGSIVSDDGESVLHWALYSRSNPWVESALSEFNPLTENDYLSRELTGWERRDCAPGGWYHGIPWTRVSRTRVLVRQRVVRDV